MSKNTKNNLLLVLCTLINFTLVFFISYIDQKTQIIRFTETLFIPTASFQGSLQAVISLVCISIVFIDYKKGIYLSYSNLCVVVVHDILTIFVENKLTPVPGLISVIVSFTTVTILYKFYSKQAENSITDYVTGLYNRRKFVEDVESLISGKKHFYLANVTIKDFTKIVDSYGLKAGDYILKVVSDVMLRNKTKSIDIYRIGGSNYSIIFPDKKNPEEFIASLQKELNQDIIIPKSYSVSESTDINCKLILLFGITKSEGHEADYTNIFTQSEIALSMAKNSTNQTVFFYDEKMKNNQAEIEKLIIESLNNEYFYLVYQPQYEISKKKLRGFETLIRCRKPDGTIVNPDFYIPIAEKTNLIFNIDDFVLYRAMKEFKPVLDSISEKITISINVSARNFSRKDFTEKVFSAANEIGFPLECLEIEITEYSLAESMEETVNNIKALREKNVHIALDDFGTGYSSMAQVMNLPINLLKIDKSLIDGIANSKRSQDLVDSVIYFGHIMNCEVISEGVEEEPQLDFLSKHKCDFVQGFIWGRPISYEEAVILSKEKGN